MGACEKADERRTQRAVKIASALARDPMSSFPKQMGGQADTKAMYRFLESAKTSYEQLMRPHVRQTREKMQELRRVLLIQDMTEIDYAHHPQTQGLGPVGNGNHQGYLLQTVLAVDPDNEEFLGIATQEPFLRQPAPEGETSTQRKKRKQKESQVWLRQAQEIGMAKEGCEWVHVGDRGSDIFAFLRQCLKLGGDFLVRVKHDRLVDLLVDQAETALPKGARRHVKRQLAGTDVPEHLFLRSEKLESIGSADAPPGWQS
jgi:Transposase DNA-binding